MSENKNEQSHQMLRFLKKMFPRTAKAVIIYGFRKVKKLVRIISFNSFLSLELRTINSVIFNNRFSYNKKLSAYNIEGFFGFGKGTNVFYVGASRGEQYREFLLEVARFSGNYIVFKSKSDYQIFKGLLKNIEDEDRVFWIPNIDSELDEEVYRYSRQLSAEFVGELCRCLSSLNFDEIYIDSFRSLELAVCDRFQSWVRNIMFLKKLLVSKKAKRFYCVGDSVSNEDLIAFVLEADNFSSSVINNEADSNSHISIREFVDRLWNTPGHYEPSVFDIKGSLQDGEGFVLYAGILNDDLYRETASLVLTELVNKIKHKVLFLPSSPKFNSFGVQGVSVVNRIERKMPDDLKRLLLQGLDGAFSNFVDFGADNEKDEFEWKSRLYLISNLHRSLFKLVLDCYSLTEELQSVVGSNELCGVISNPGRLWYSQVLTGRFFAQPTFEIQCGTLTRTLRYKAPRSQYILAVDDISKEVYCNYLGVDETSVYVVGAPRIDAKLVDIREKNPSKSREFLGLPAKAKVLCVATQPYGKELMASMVKESARVLSSDYGDWFLVVSMHPNEASEYQAAYEHVLKNMVATGKAWISQGEIYNCINAADSVVTYFSTSGLEAFCLNKAVFSFRPSGQESVPFDLCKLGVAQPFSNGEELAALLNQEGDERPVTEGLRNLQDGRSVSRICNFIAERI